MVGVNRELVVAFLFGSLISLCYVCGFLLGSCVVATLACYGRECVESRLEITLKATLSPVTPIHKVFH